jgi:aerobic C4-dicarboxylate transport protein
VKERQPFYQTALFQMLAAMGLGVIFGVCFPHIGTALSPLASGFIKLIRMVVCLIIFATVTVGIAHIGNGREVGRIGLRSILYFEVVSTLALLFGLAMGNVFQPGAGMNINPATLDSSAVSAYTETAKPHSAIDFILDIIPKTAVDAFAQGSLLQALLFSILFGFALLRLGERAQPVVDLIERFSEIIFDIVSMVMKAASLAVFGAMSLRAESSRRKR